MFSGIIEEIGTITTITPRGDSCKLHITAATVTTDIHSGDSIAVNGICLTADVMKETLDRSVLGHVGDPVNLERALPVTGRLGGHIVQGHVDTTTTLIHREIGEHWHTLRFHLPPQLAKYVVEKGSIAINGTSLTVSAIGDDYFEVSLIPTTLTHTNLGTLQPGDSVNLEADILAKHVEKLLAH